MWKCIKHLFELFSAFIIMLKFQNHQLINKQLRILLVLTFIFINPLNAKGCIIPCDMKPSNSKTEMAGNYEEYALEHQVTQTDAFAVLKQLNDSFFKDNQNPGCRRFLCDSKMMHYCLGPKFINDHCWCEQAHERDSIPFIPHICYVGRREYKASIGSCYFFSEVKECCCLHALARQWRHLSAAPQSTSVNNLVIYLLPLLYPLRYLLS